MEFFAFPVHMGDSFLLKDKDFTLLVDGGDGKVPILNHLLDKLRQHSLLNVIICSHYDQDHIDGLLDFFQHLIDEFIYSRVPSVKIEEIWLPDIFARIEHTKNYQQIYVPRHFGDKEVRVRVEKKDGTNVELQKIKGEFDIAIYKICRIVRTCYFLKAFNIVNNIRWFELKDSCVDQIVQGTNIYGINCLEIARRITQSLTADELILQFTRINEESLVFRYNSGDDDFPNVLFTADSNFSFCEGRYLDIVKFASGKTIVTTPHHGSNDEEHVKVYTNFGRTPREFIFVRSSEFHRNRPCTEFVQNKPNNYCVRCKRDEEQTVHLIYTQSSGKWRAATGIKLCSCKPVKRQKK